MCVRIRGRKCMRSQIADVGAEDEEAASRRCFAQSSFVICAQMGSKPLFSDRYWREVQYT